MTARSTGASIVFFAASLQTINQPGAYGRQWNSAVQRRAPRRKSTGFDASAAYAPGEADPRDQGRHPGRHTRNMTCLGRNRIGFLLSIKGPARLFRLSRTRIPHSPFNQSRDRPIEKWASDMYGDDCSKVAMNFMKARTLAFLRRSLCVSSHRWKFGSYLTSLILTTSVI